MCVIFLAIDQHSEHPLILLANRDEFYDRPTAKAARWEDQPTIFAGRDLVSSGTWLGVTDAGRFAAVTNYRDPSAPDGTHSRGKLVSDFLTTYATPLNYLQAVERHATEYPGFNLIVGEIKDRSVNAVWYSNRGEGVRTLSPGIYGLSNHLLDTPWPKVRKGKAEFEEILKGGLDRDAMFRLLADRTLAEDRELPDTGTGYEREKLLSSIFIETPVYGTRCSNVILADRDGRFDFEERVFV